MQRCGSRRAGSVSHAIRACGPRRDRPPHRAGPQPEGKAVMPAGITSSDSMFSVRETPWHGLGAVLAGPPARIPGAMEASGLAWRVEREPIAATAADAATVNAWWEPRSE